MCTTENTENEHKHNALCSCVCVEDEAAGVLVCLWLSLEGDAAGGHDVLHWDAACIVHVWKLRGVI